MRALAVDFGSKRIGVAVGDSASGLCSPRSVLAASGKLATDAQAIAALARAEEAEAIVVGIPENPDDPRMSKVCRRLAEEIEKLGWTVETVDETLTSATAEERLMETEMTAAKRRKRLDSEAACQILERFFHA